MSVTVIGCLLTRDGLSQGREAGYRRRTRSWASSALELRSVQKSRVALNIDHDDQLELGQVIALHRSKQGDVWALSVADSENADRLLEFDRPLYYSVGVTMRRDWSDVLIEHASLTDAPATVSLQPVRLLPGGLDSRGSWSLTGLEKELVDEAADQRRYRHRGDPLRIGGEEIVAGMRAADVDPFALEEAMSPPPGPLRYRPARIVSVR